MPAWATVAITLGASALTGATALMAVWLQNRAAERRRREEARARRVREAANVIVPVRELLSDGNPDRLAVNIRREEPFAEYTPVRERWNDVRPALLSFAFAHPDPTMQGLGEELIAAVWNTLSCAASLLRDLANDRGDIVEGRARAMQHHTEATELAKRMMSVARASD